VSRLVRAVDFYCQSGETNFTYLQNCMKNFCFISLNLSGVYRKYMEIKSFSKVST
jgi:hypothetical protein